MSGITSLPSSTMGGTGHGKHVFVTNMADIAPNVTLNASDIEIGAVELKDGSTNNRAVINSAGELSMATSAALGDGVAANAALVITADGTNASAPLAVVAMAYNGATLDKVRGDTIRGVYTQSSPKSGTLTDRSGTIAAINTSQQVMAANASRKYVFYQNVSSDDQWISELGATAVKDSPCIKLPSNSIYEPNFVTTSAITVISATAGKFTAREA